jgi:hydrogenase nickel incorporation protein HypA/HybF
MHETAIVTGLMRIIETQAARHGTTRVNKVRLKVGRLRAVEPQQLSSCFEMFAEGTVAEGAELIIDVVEVRGRCRVCRQEFDIPRFRFECPACGGNDIEVTQGQELYIESFDADSGPAATGASESVDRSDF